MFKINEGDVVTMLSEGTSSMNRYKGIIPKVVLTSELVESVKEVDGKTLVELSDADIVFTDGVYVEDGKVKARLLPMDDGFTSKYNEGLV